MGAKQKKANERLRYQRELRGWSQKKVGMELGTSKDMVSRWETGDREVSLFYREKLCALFGVSAVELGFIQPSRDEQLALSISSSPSIQTLPLQEVLPLLTTAISQGIIMAVRELERTDMDTTKRDLLKLIGSSIVLAGMGDAAHFLDAMLNGDQLAMYMHEMSTRWAIYHSGDTLQALNGLDLWLPEMEVTLKEANRATQPKAFELISLSRQLQGSLYRDRMDYTRAHDAYKRAYLVADEHGNNELKSSALARRGVTFIQQQRPIEAIQYLEGALAVIEGLTLPSLSGYIYQALSEAHAMAQHKDESQANIEAAEQVLTQNTTAIEISNCQLNTTSVTAQKGVNAVLLQDYRQAMTLLNTGIAQYNPRLQRGRARLIAQKAEAFYGLGSIEQSTETAATAYSIAEKIGSEKTISRIKNLYQSLQQSPYRKEKSVIHLGMILA